MPKIILILFFALPTYAAIPQVCENAADKKAAQFAANSKAVETTTKKVAGEKLTAEFQKTEEYEWARFANPTLLGKLGAPKDRDYCSETYQDFIKEKNEKKSQDTLEFWRACLISNYRDEVPDMAKKLLSCHGAKATDDEAAEKKSYPPEVK